MLSNFPFRLLLIAVDQIVCCNGYEWWIPAVVDSLSVTPRCGLSGACYINFLKEAGRSYTNNAGAKAWIVNLFQTIEGRVAPLLPVPGREETRLSLGEVRERQVVFFSSSLFLQRDLDSKGPLFPHVARVDHKTSMSQPPLLG